MRIGACECKQQTPRASRQPFPVGSKQQEPRAYGCSLFCVVKTANTTGFCFSFPASSEHFVSCLFQTCGRRAHCGGKLMS
eukprot:g51343.t1